MRVEDEVRSLRRRNDELSRMKLRIIRILVILGGFSWIMEMIPSILKLRGGTPDYLLREKLLDKAIYDLESDGIIVEPRVRGCPSRKRSMRIS